MPPEQAAGKRGQVGPHSDVYSLGAILYHLLTARPPFLAETLTETLQLVQHTDAIAPRLLNPAVPRDLETVCLKCLEKEPRQRYANAQALAEELGRFLCDEPIVARPIGTAGKAWRWCRRKPALAAALAACALALVSGVSGITWQWRRAEQNAKNEERQRQRAEQNAARSEQVAQFLKDMLKGVKPSVALGRDTTMLREILDKTAERLSNDLKNQSTVEAELRSTIGEVYYAIGDYAKAEAMAREALDLWKKVLGPNHAKLASALNKLAEALLQRGKDAEAEALLRDALALGRTGPGNDLSVAHSLNDLALLRKRQGQFAEAEALHREGHAIFTKLLGYEHPDVAQSLNNAAAALGKQGKYAEAEPLFREALAMRIKLLGSGHPRVSDTLDNLAWMLKKQYKHAELEVVYREAVEMARKTATNDPSRLESRLFDLADNLYRQGKYADAEPLYREFHQRRRAGLGAEHEDVLQATASLARLLSDWAWVERTNLVAADVRRLTPNSQSQTERSLVTSASTSPLERAREAESLLRDCLATRLRGTNANHWRTGDVKSRLGGALLAVAVTESSSTTDTRLSRLTEAESLLLEGHERLQQSKSASRIYKRDALERRVRLYEVWDAAAPSSAKSAQAEEWKKKLEAFRAEAEDALDSK